MSLTGFLVVSAALFTLGAIMFISRRNTIAILMGVELLLNAGALNFVAFSWFTAAPEARLDGQIFAVFIILLAAAEAVVALAIALAVYRDFDSIRADQLINLKG
jgi:NADH-quinone oxidoreductase subunit K